MIRVVYRLQCVIWTNKKAPLGAGRVERCGLITGAMFTVVIVDAFDVIPVGAGQLFGFALDRCADVRSAGPGAISKDLANATPILTEMPVRALTVAIVFVDVDFHVVGRAGAESYFKAFRAVVSHRDTSFDKIQAETYASSYYNNTIFIAFCQLSKRKL